MLQKIKNIYHFFSALAAAVFYGFPARKLTVIGVTGTDGKTTTATLIYQILKKTNKKAALITSVAAFIGSEEIDTGFHVTTPNPWPLQKLLKKIVNKGTHFLVLESTSHGLDQHRLFGIPFSIGVLTNITHEHLDYHQNFQSYLQAKAKLFSRVKHAVLNKDDASYKRVLPLISSSAIIHSYSLKKNDKNLTSKIRLCFDEEYNCSNALAAYKVGMILGVKDKLMISAMKSFPGIKGRMEKIPNNKDINIFVDFAHTPNALEQALKSLRAISHPDKVEDPRSKHRDKPSAKLIAVFGSAGLRDAAKRPLMGEIGSKLADIVVLTAEDPRTEDVNQIISQMKQGITGKAKIIIEPDRGKAIDLAINQLARKGDTVAVFGKGHEKSISFGKIEYPWSDHEAIKKSLSKKKSS